MEIKIKGKDVIYSFEIVNEVTKIGRASDNDFVIPLEDFSRHHCQLTIKGKYTYIMDLGSKNGASIDGKKIKANEQFPIYQHTKIIMANYFELLLPDSYRENEIGIIIETPAIRTK